MSDPYYDTPSRPSVGSFFWPLLLLLGSMGFLVWWFWPMGSGLNPEAKPRSVDARGSLMELEKTNISIYERAAPSVVHVTNLMQLQNRFSLNLQQIPRGTGSGFIWDEGGRIVTNYHVVNGADAAKVVLADHSSYDVRRMWSYPEKDIAVLWIDAPKSRLRPIRIGTSHDLKVGQVAYAIGNPFGLDHTMTDGIISALGREVQAADGYPIQGAIQTSAAINPGNSGGPLLDSDARLIGMNTAIVSPSGAFAGIGFAIPVEEVNLVVTELISKGKVVRPRIGVQLAETQQAEQLGVKQGMLIMSVLPNTPAAAAGLKGTGFDASGKVSLGDVIVAVDGKDVANVKELYAALEPHKVGDTITLTILRDGQRKDIQITLRAME